MYMIRKLQKEDVKPEWLDKYPDVAEARILSISKDDLRLDEKQLLWGPHLEKEIYEYWATLNGYWENRTIPKCTCLEHDGGFMGRRSAKGKVYNDFFWEDEPCSLKWYAKCKKEGRLETLSPYQKHKVIDHILEPKYSTDEILISVASVPEDVEHFLIKFKKCNKYP